MKLTMSGAKSCFARLIILPIVIALVSVLSPASVASAGDFALQQVDKDRIDAYIQERMQLASIPGLALGVVAGDQIVYLKGYGIAAPDGRAVTPQTPFMLGSTSKSFTALAVMQLVEAGKIDLDAPVTAYLPWFRTSDAAASGQITVRHLLNQNSGLPSYEGRKGLLDNDRSSTALENGVRALSTVQLNHPAGQVYEYANENYDTLGLIVQVVSGMSYEDYIRSAIFEPLQMRHSAAELSDPAVTDIATGYRCWFFWPVAFDAPYTRRTTPSGFLISSAEDMTHYLIAGLNGGTYGNNRVLSPEGIATLHTPGSKISASSSYGMGWVIQKQSGTTEIWHNGDLSNFHSNMLLLPDRHTGIVILINISEYYNSTAVNIPIEGVAEILLGASLSTRTSPPLNIDTQLLMLAAVLITVLWMAGSYLAMRRWQYRGELPPRGVRCFGQFWLPLTIDMLPVAAGWIILPAQFNTPMDTIALFTPDIFLVIVILTVLSSGQAAARIVLTFRLHRLTQLAGSKANIVPQDAR